MVIFRTFFLYLSLVPRSNPGQDKWSFFFSSASTSFCLAWVQILQREESSFFSFPHYWLLLSPNSSSLKHKPWSPLPEGLSHCSLPSQCLSPPSQRRSQTASTTAAFPSLTSVFSCILYGLIWYFGFFSPFFLPHHCRSVLVCSQGLLATV